MQSHPVSHHIDAVRKVIEHLVLRCEMGAVGAERPLDVSRGEERVRLVQTHIRVGVDPHPADPASAVDYQDPMVLGQLPAGHRECVEPRHTCPDDGYVVRPGFAGGGGHVVKLLHSTLISEAILPQSGTATGRTVTDRSRSMCATGHGSFKRL